MLSTCVVILHAPFIGGMNKHLLSDGSSNVKKGSC